MKNRRKRLIISSGLQLRYVGAVLFAMLFVALLEGGIVYRSIWLELLHESRYSDWTPFLMSVKRRADFQIFFSVAGLLVIVGLISIYMSHRIAGPLYRLKQYFTELAKGDLSFKMEVRKSDELSDMINEFNAMVSGLKKCVSADRQKVNEIKETIQEILPAINKDSLSEEEKNRAIATLKNSIEKLKEITSQYKI